MYLFVEVYILRFRGNYSLLDKKVPLLCQYNRGLSRLHTKQSTLQFLTQKLVKVKRHRCLTAEGIANHCPLSIWISAKLNLRFIVWQYLLFENVAAFIKTHSACIM